jgi:hypothetical protein
MDRERMIEVLKRDRDLALFDPTTGECRPMNELNAESAEALEMAIIELEQQEIIRCRDCKYSIDEYNDGDCYCKRPSRELVWIGKSWDFFCQAGRRKT